MCSNKDKEVYHIYVILLTRTNAITVSHYKLGIREYAFQKPLGWCCSYACLSLNQQPLIF